MRGGAESREGSWAGGEPATPATCLSLLKIGENNEEVRQRCAEIEGSRDVTLVLLFYNLMNTSGR